MPQADAKRTTPKCPRCHGRGLEELGLDGHAVDVCARCSGLWCESSRWNPERLGDAPVVGPFRERAPDVIAEGQSKLKCPECARPLTILRVRAVEGLEIDQCDGCGGVWFDHREWEYLEALRSWQAHTDSSQRPPSWAEWAFQIVLRLPVEFNVPPRRVPFATIVIIALCVIVQALGGFAQWGNYGVQLGTQFGLHELSTLFAYQFIHAGWLHLFANMYFLYILGDNIEDVMGAALYVPLFLLSGAAAAVVFLFVTVSGAPPLVGASGAVAGVMAAYLILFRDAKLTFMLIIKQIKIPAWGWLAIWLVLQIAFALYDPTGARTHVAWVAHIGGFAVGFFLIWPLRHFLVERHALLHLLHTRRI